MAGKILERMAAPEQLSQRWPRDSTPSPIPRIVYGFIKRSTYKIKLVAQLSLSAIKTLNF